MSTTLFRSLGPAFDIGASPGPWAATETGFCNGALLIEDANGEIIGWATDAAGHTTESCRADRRSAAQVRQNARRMAEAPAALDLVRVLARLRPIALAAYPDLSQAQTDAVALLQRLGEL